MTAQYVAGQPIEANVHRLFNHLTITRLQETSHSLILSPFFTLGSIFLTHAFTLRLFLK